MQRKVSGRRRRRLRRLRRRRALVLGGMILAVGLIVYLITYLSIRGTVNKVAKDTILDNVYIAGVDVSGMKAKGAKKALEAQLEEYRSNTVKLAAEEAEAEVTLGELGFQVQDLDKLIERAVAFGKEGSVWSRYRTQKNLKKDIQNFEATYTVDPEAAKKAIAEKMPELENAAREATIRRENGTFVITDGVTGKMIDLEESVKILKSYFNKEWKYPDTKKVKLATTLEEPKVTREQLEQIKDPLGTFSTFYAMGTNRGKNVEVATANINGAVLMPGEEYSASVGMGPNDAEHGYVEAGSYENGQTVNTYGGGVCQVSTTLYNAVILSELEVTERWAHSMLVDYVQPSMDAAIAEGYKDLKFKNNTDTPVYIEGVTSGGKLTFTVYGRETRSSNRKVSFVSEVTSRSEEQKKFVASEDPVGTLVKTVSAHIGTKAKLWKVVTENGAEVSRNTFNNSSYQASPSTWKVGVGTDNAEARRVLEEAIKTQNEAQIQAAIAQAQAILAAAQQPAAPPAGE